MARRRRRKRRRLSPRFFVTILILAGLAVSVFLLVKKIKGDDTDVVAVATPVPTATPGPTATPKPSLPPNVTVVRAESANPSKLGISGEVAVSRKTVSGYSRENALSFGRDVEYSEIPGVLTFGGNNYRNTFSFGTPIVSNKRLAEQWSVPIGALGNWSGTGWTGMPLIIHWPNETLRFMNVTDALKTQQGGLTEIIYPAMDGNIYFLDLLTGKATRDPIAAGVVQKGTACIDPRGYPVLYVGQGIPVENDEGNKAAQIRVYNLITQELIYTFGGFDWFGYRTWQAYDGSPIINNDAIVYGGENGVLYTSRLNTSYDASTGTLTMDPELLVKLRYQGNGYSKSDKADTRWYGIESSVAAFRNFAFFTDNGGRLLCVDMNTMSVKYAVDVTDESDASVVIEESFDDNTIYLYTGSQVRVENGDAPAGYGYSYQRKINGLTGAIVWEKKQLCSIGDATASGGLVATPHVGKATSNISNLVIYALSLAVQTGQTGAAVTAAPAAASAAPAQDAQDAATESGEDLTGDAGGANPTASGGTYQLGGRLVAYDKGTGEIVWAIEQSNDYWSSPVVVYDDGGRGYLIQCDRGGIMTFYDASDGTQLNTVDLGSRIDSTPAVFGNYIVVGTRGKGGAGKAAKIACIKIS